MLTFKIGLIFGHWSVYIWALVRLDLGFGPFIFGHWSGLGTSYIGKYYSCNKSVGIPHIGIFLRIQWENRIQILLKS